MTLASTISTVSFGLRVERYILCLCREPQAFADLRRGPDTLLEACRARDGEAAEAATRAALLWVLAELQRMLDNAGGSSRAPA